MSSKSRRPLRPQSTPSAPVLSLEEVAAILAGQTSRPTCCVPHRRAYDGIVAFLSRQAAPAACLLCAGRADMRGVFAPFDQQRYGAKPGKHKFLVYPICTQCFALPEREARVEAWALTSARAGMAQAKAAWN